MNTVDYIYNLLNKGFLLKVYFVDSENNKKYVYLLNSDWINMINIYDKVFEKNKIIDICLDKKFSFRNKKPYNVEYVYIPPDIDQSLIDSLDFKNDKEYILNIIESILNIKLIFSNYLLFFKLKLNDINNNKKLDINQLIISTYPNHNNHTNNLKKIKYDIIKNFFNVDEDIENNSQNKDQKILNIFNFLGINIKNKNVTDPFFLTALRKRWNSLIIEQKHKIFDKLKEEEFLNEIEEIEKNEYTKELLIFKKEMFKSDMESLNELKTIKEIISYWPPMLFPIPSFVYNEY